jgi:predicted transcriptional regulator
MDEAHTDRFTWHPEYHGRTRQDVTNYLEAEIASDQRAYALALEAAEDRENQVLQSIINLEKRWGDYDMGWAETEPAELAERIVNFEWEREQRHELVPYSEYRDSVSPPVSPGTAPDRPWWAFWRR